MTAILDDRQVRSTRGEARHDGTRSNGKRRSVPPGAQRMARPWRLALIGVGIAVGLVSRLFIANGAGSLNSDTFVLAAAASSALVALGIVAQAAERDRFGTPLALLTVIAGLSLGVVQWISPHFSPGTLEWSASTQAALALLGAANGLLFAGIIGLALTRRLPTFTVAATLLAGVIAVAANSVLLRNEWPAILGLAAAFGALLVAWDQAPRHEPAYEPGDEPPRISRAALGLTTVVLSGAAIQLWISRGEDIGTTTPAVGVAAILIVVAFMALIRIRRDIQQRTTALSEWTSWMREIRTRDFQSDFENLSLGRDGAVVGDVTAEPARPLSFPDLAPIAQSPASSRSSGGSGHGKEQRSRRSRRSSKPKPSFEWVDLDDVDLVLPGINDNPAPTVANADDAVQVPGFDTDAGLTAIGWPPQPDIVSNTSDDTSPIAVEPAREAIPDYDATSEPQWADDANAEPAVAPHPAYPVGAINEPVGAAFTESLQPSLFADLPPTALELAWADTQAPATASTPPAHTIDPAQPTLFDLDHISWIDQDANAHDHADGAPADVSPAPSADAEPPLIVPLRPMPALAEPAVQLSDTSRAGAFSGWLGSAADAAPAVSRAWAGPRQADAVIDWLAATAADPARVVVAIETMSLPDHDQLSAPARADMIDATAKALDSLAQRPQFVAHIDGPYLFAVWEHQTQSARVDVNRAALHLLRSQIPTADGTVTLSGTLAFLLPGATATFDTLVSDAIDGLVLARRAEALAASAGH